MTERYLTTGQAATRCSVSPDTVLKWIRSGLLRAQRTAGGHHRIDERDLERILTPSEEGNESPSPKVSQRRFRYCWEYYGKGTLHKICKKCAVYIMRALRCYEVGRFAPDNHHPKVFCKQSCEECEYYKEVHGQTLNVLVVTDDDRLTEELKEAAHSARFNLEIADCEYSCSMAVNHFKPDFAVVDCSLGRDASRQITNHLAEDPRIPFTRVVMAGNEGEFPQECEKVVFARLKRPFDLEDIRHCIMGTMTDRQELKKGE
ncbi:MAG: MerR family transcriptional regulator [Planctomycetota bacterium]